VEASLGFNVFGLSASISPSFELDFGNLDSWNDLAQLPVKIGQWILDNVEEVFKFLLDKLNQLGKWIKDGIIWLGNEIGKGLKEAYQWTAEMAAKFLDGAGQAVEEIGKALADAYNCTKEAIAGAMKAIGKGIEDAARAIQAGLNVAVEEVSKALESAWGAVSGAISDAISTVFCCFPEGSIVYVLDPYLGVVIRKQIQELLVGDLVESADDAGTICWSPVFQIDAKLVPSRMLEITLRPDSATDYDDQEQFVVQMTRLHLIYYKPNTITAGDTAECSVAGQLATKTAAEIEAGDSVWVRSPSEACLVERKVQDVVLKDNFGLYTVTCGHGRMLVNGVLASCFESTGLKAEVIPPKDVNVMSWCLAAETVIMANSTTLRLQI